MRVILLSGVVNKTPHSSPFASLVKEMLYVFLFLCVPVVFFCEKLGSGVTACGKSATCEVRVIIGLLLLELQVWLKTHTLLASFVKEMLDFPSGLFVCVLSGLLL